MKRTINLLALFVLVSVNVFTPVSYAQSDETVEALEPENVSPVVIYGEEETGGGETVLGKQIEELVEDLPEIVEEQPEVVSEDTTPSLIDMVVDTFDDFSEEVVEPEDVEDDFIMPSRGEITVTDETLVTKSITHDAENGLIKLKIGYDEDGDHEISGDESYEVWVKDRNEGASESALTGKAFKLKQLMDDMCHFSVMTDNSIDLTVSELNYSEFECDEGFAAEASALAETSINTYAEGMTYINEHWNGAKSYGNYYWWGNDGYASYEELSCKQAILSEGLDDGCSLRVDNPARERGFLKYSRRNEGRYEGGYDNPCDISKGEYLPSPYDWADLVGMWKNIKNDVSMAIPMNNDIRIYGGENMNSFIVDLMIPKAGYISRYNPYLHQSLSVSQDEANLYYANNFDSLRTSFGENSNYPGRIVMDYSDYDGLLYTEASSFESYANPVRCFVATDPVTITIKFNNGEPDKIMKIQRGNILYELENPVRNGYVFDGWFDLNDNEFYFNEEIDGDLTLIAKRTQCAPGQIVRDNQCVYEVEHDFINGILKVTDGERMIYISDKNVGAAISAGLDKYREIEYYASQYCSFISAGSVDDIQGSLYIKEGSTPECSSEFYEKAAEVIGHDINSFGEIIDFVSTYNMFTDTGYNYSFGNYYFRGNNSGVAYTGLVIENSEEDGLVVSNYYPDLISIGFSGGNLENSGWVEGYYNNPCDNSKGEYLPTPNDWAEVMDIWYVNNHFNGGYSGPESLAATPDSYRIGYRDSFQFQQDLLIPEAGKINKNCYGDFRGVYSSSEDELGCSLTYDNSPTIALWAGRNSDGYLGSLIDGYLTSTKDGSERDAYPVRCFVYVEPKDVIFVDGDKTWTVKVESGDVVLEPEYTQSEGHTFNGWYNGTQEWDFESPVTRNITLTAKYDTITKTVTFQANGGSLVNPIEVEYGKVITNLPTSHKDGFILEGWYVDEGLTKKYNNQPIIDAVTLYAHWTENKPSGGYSGGGGSSSKSDKSNISTDEPNKETMDAKKDEPKVEETKKEEQPSQGKTLDTTSPSKETFNAHQWAYSNGLTKYRTAGEARMDDPLNRSEMAKISSIFATQFLDKVPNEKKKEFCSQYPDLWKVTSDMEAFIIESCELGYMGYESNGIDALERFRPYTPVTVAEAATILSRIVWGNDNAMNGKDWYKGHLYASYNHGLIDDIKDPTKRSITRREAYLMLYRLITAHE